MRDEKKTDTGLLEQEILAANYASEARDIIRRTQNAALERAASRLMSSNQHLCDHYAEMIRALKETE